MPLSLAVVYTLTFCSVFFHVGIATAAGARLEDRPMRFLDLIKRTFQQGDHIAVWALLAAGVAVAFRFAGTTLPGSGALLAFIVEGAWVLLTIFVIPMLALEDVGPIHALRRSGNLLRRGWGEGLTGLVGIGAWQFLLSLPGLFLVVAGIAAAVLGSGGLPIMGAGFLVLLVVGAAAGAVRQVFAVELYRYATGTVP